MARSGLNKIDVKRARNVLLAQNRYPSVDAIRIELGNTGSKSTIHKYLKELEEQDVATQALNLNLSDVLQDMVARLAEQLLSEANTKIEEAKQHFEEKEQQLKDQSNELRNQLEHYQQQLRLSENNLANVESDRELLVTQLQKESISRHTLEQQVVGLKDLLSESNAHSASLEEKHKHAQRTLEHYREAMKEQREQDNRRHEQQTQQLQAEMRQLQQTIIVKQDQISTLSADNTKLTTELKYQVDHQTKLSTENIELLSRIDMLTKREQVLLISIAEKDQNITAMNIQLDTTAQINNDLVQSQSLMEKELISCQVKLESQQVIFTQFQDVLLSQQK